LFRTVQQAFRNIKKPHCRRHFLHFCNLPPGADVR